MLCDELKTYGMADPAIDEEYEMYKVAEVDAAIAELKAKLETVNELVKTSKDLYDRSIESLKASHYAEMVDAGMRERRLRWALWLARALRARDIQRWWIAATCAPMTERACSVWNNVERKCLKKAGFYL